VDFRMIELFPVWAGGKSGYLYNVLLGSKWGDVAECHFTAASLRELYDISSLPSALSLHIAADGSLIANAANGGMISWRVQYVSTGTYAGGTTLQIDPRWSQPHTAMMVTPADLLVIAFVLARVPSARLRAFGCSLLIPPRGKAVACVEGGKDSRESTSDASERVEFTQAIAR
jgi:hypothetical protein